MPPQISFSKDDILEAALTIVRQEGLGVLTARRIAKELKSSTHPIYRAFESMQELEEAVIEKAKAYAIAFLLEEQEPGWPFLSIGMQYLRFARQEKELFNMLFMSGRMVFDMNDAEGPFMSFVSRMQEAPHLAGLGEASLKRIYTNMWIFTHGLATLFNVNSIQQSEESIHELLSQMGRTVIEWEQFHAQHPEKFLHTHDRACCKNIE